MKSGAAAELRDWSLIEALRSLPENPRGPYQGRDREENQYGAVQELRRYNGNRERDRRTVGNLAE